MFCEKKSNILFIKGVWLSDCIESEPVIITQPKPKPKPKPIVKNPCVFCGDVPASDEFFIVSSIAKTGDRYIYSKLGNDNFCGTDCVAQHITNNFKMIEMYALMENLTFYKNNKLI